MYQAGMHHSSGMQPTYMHGDTTNAYLHGHSNSGTSPVYVPTTRHSMFSSPSMNNGYMHGTSGSTGVPTAGQLSPSSVVAAAASGVWGQHESVAPSSGSVLGNSSMYSGSVSGSRFPFSPTPSPPPGSRSSLPQSGQPHHSLGSSATTPSLLDMSAGPTSVSPHQYGRSPYSTPVGAAAAYMSGTELSAWGNVGYGSPHPHSLGFAATAAAAAVVSQQGFNMPYGKNN